MVLRRAPTEKEITEYNLNFFRLYYGLSLEELASFREKYDERLLSVLGSNIGGHHSISGYHGTMSLPKLKEKVELMKQEHEEQSSPFNEVMARHFGFALRNFDSLVQAINEGKRVYTSKLLCE